MKTAKTSCAFKIKPSQKAVKWAWGFCVAITALEVWLMISVGKTDKAIYVLAPTAVVVIFILGGIAFSLNKVRFEVSGKGLDVQGDMFGKLFALETLDLANAKIVNLNREESLRPKWKLMGTALPGYAAGWFKLRDGQKAHVFLTDLSDVLYVPTREGSPVLVSSEDNVALLEAMQEMVKP